MSHGTWRRSIILSKKRDPRVLILGTADWHQSIATNQHYMVRELATAHSVTFVESLGLRRPELNMRDFQRIVRRLTGRHGNQTRARPIPDRVEILSPRVIPFHSGPLAALNRVILNHNFKTWLHSEGPRVFWTYSPVTYGFEVAGQVAIYHCVDLYAEFPGIDADLINRSERRLARSNITAIGSSQAVVEHLEKQGFRDVIYWPNVADTERIRPATVRDFAAPRSGAIFAGNLSDKKVDFELLSHLVREGVELHLAGPVSEGGGESRRLVDNLVASGAHYHGVLDLAALSEVMAERLVGLIPYLINPYTLGVSPLKTYEYLAAGLAVVSSALPGVEARNPHVQVVASRTQFLNAVREYDSPDSAETVSERVKIADAHSWIKRGAEARALITATLSDAVAIRSNRVNWKEPNAWHENNGF